jgi:hypothetical protein
MLESYATVYVRSSGGSMRLIVIAAISCLAACSSGADTQLAQQAVTQFHAALDSGQSAAIYDASADDLKKVSTREKFAAFLDAVHRKLGNSKSSTQRGWGVNYQSSGTFVTLTYGTTYSEGDATEQFVYRLADDQALLVGYHITSNAFVLN